MGIDRVYQALPDPCELLEQAKVDPLVTRYLPVIPSYLSIAHESRRMMERRPNINMTVFALAQDLVLKYPGIAQRTYHPHRTHDWLLYLLSGERRQRDWAWEEASDTGSQIVNGAQALPCVYEKTPDHPLRYSSAFEVQVLALYLEGITTDHLHQFYDPHVMEAHHVYKFATWKAEWAWPHIIAEYEGFRAFYLEVAAAQEAMLVITG
jgi:hypothetical protein